MKQDTSNYHIQTLPDEKLKPAWRESAFCRFSDLIIPDQGLEQFEFTQLLDKKIVGLGFYVLDEEGVFQDKSDSHTDHKIVLTLKQLEFRVINIIDLNGIPDESAKALRAKEYYREYERKPKI